MTEFSCVTCGACCDASQFPDHYAGLTPEEADAMPPWWIRFDRNDWGMKYPFLSTKLVDGIRVCVAFEGKLGVDCSCSIYDRRPGVCREFKPGGLDCIECRADLRLPTK